MAAKQTEVLHRGLQKGPWRLKGWRLPRRVRGRHRGLAPEVRGRPPQQAHAPLGLAAAHRRLGQLGSEGHTETTVCKQSQTLPQFDQHRKNTMINND